MMSLNELLVSTCDRNFSKMQLGTLTLGVLAVMPAYMGVGAGAGRPDRSRSVRAMAWPSSSKEIRHGGGFGSKFLNRICH